MAIRYLVEGTAALKPQQHAKHAGTLVSLQPASRGMRARLLDQMQVRGHEKTAVDAVLDDFAGARLSASRSDRLFCLLAGGIGAAVLFAFTYLSIL